MYSMAVVARLASSVIPVGHSSEATSLCGRATARHRATSQTCHLQYSLTYRTYMVTTLSTDTVSVWRV